MVVTAAASNHYHFSHWGGDTNGCGIAGNAITAAMTRARSITATFALDEHTLTVDSAHGGTDPGTETAAWGSALSQYVTNSPVSGGVGTQYVCTAGAVVGNDFTQLAPTNVTLTLTNNATLTWEWDTEYRLNTEAGAGGSVDEPDQWVTAGSNLVVTAAASNHYHFSHWGGDTNGCGIAGNAITAAMTRARSITANFALDEHTLTVISAHGGTDPGTETAAWGSALSQYVTNSPVSGGVGTQYVCTAGAVVDNDFTQLAPTNVTLTLTNNATLTWQWDTEYRLNTEAGAGGSVDEPDQWVEAGSNLVVTAAASNHYHFSHWGGDTNGCGIAGNAITAAMTRARSITANFALDEHTLTVISAHGGTDPGTETAAWGAALSQSVTNSPVSGGVGTQYVCTAAAVVGNDFTQLAPTNVTLTLTNNATLTWQWDTEYRLNTEAGAGGSVDEPDRWVTAGSNLVVTAAASNHYHFSHWGGDTNGCGIAGNAITAAMTRARSITANFAPDEHTLTVVSAHGGTDPGTETAAWGSAYRNM